jgi:predicted Kef-type K+ transport protein
LPDIGAMLLMFGVGLHFDETTPFAESPAGPLFEWS